MAEKRLRSRIERARMRIELCREAKEAMAAELRAKESRTAEIRSEIEAKTALMAADAAAFAEDTAGFSGWRSRYRESQRFNGFLSETARASQFRLLSKFKLLFPVQNARSKAPTLRWILQPSAEEAKANSRQEVMRAVTLGWTSQLALAFAAILDVPLRYPVRFAGSNSSVVDFASYLGDGKVVARDFPLFTKGVDVSRAEFGLFLLNKDLAQLRFFCRLDAVGLCEIRQLDELMNLPTDMKSFFGRSGGGCQALSPPPRLPSAGLLVCDAHEVRPGDDDDFDDDEEIEVGEEPLEASPPAKADDDASDDAAVRVASVIEKEEDFSWGDVSDRTKGLSIKTSFQRRKTTKSSH